MSLKKVSYEAFVFCIFKKLGENEATNLAVSMLLGFIIPIISAQVLQNSGSQMVVLRFFFFTTLSARDHH